MTDDTRRVHFVEEFAYHNDPICDGTLVLAKCAGAGKTTACLANCVGKVLVVLPTTKRVASVRRQWTNKEFPESVTGVTAMTSARFVGRQVRQGKAHLPPMDDFDTIDELYLKSIADIISIVKRLEFLRESQHRNYKKEWSVFEQAELDAVRYEYLRHWCWMARISRSGRTAKQSWNELFLSFNRKRLRWSPSSTRSRNSYANSRWTSRACGRTACGTLPRQTHSYVCERRHFPDAWSGNLATEQEGVLRPISVACLPQPSYVEHSVPNIV